MTAAPPREPTDGHVTLRHVPGLDGLRGVAVIAVLLFHAGHLRGGFLGVDLFFTLSGFLITSLLLVEFDATGSIRLLGFWGRRARRLLPALLVVTAAATVLGWQLLHGDQLERFGVQALSTLGYVANWAEIARQHDYWALFDAPSPLDHVWSLAIEEQFYVVWPLLMIGALRFLRGRLGVWLVVVGGLAASLVVSWSVIGTVDGVTRAYYGTDTRAASILVGAGLAAFTAGRSRTASNVERSVAVLAVPATAALVASWFVADGADGWLYRWGLVAHAGLTALVIAAVAGPCAGVVGRVFEHRLLRRAGILSYGLYLWHWPTYLLLDETRTGLDGWTLTAVRVACSVLLATVSYHVVESPIRTRRVRLPKPALTTAGAFATVALLVVALVGVPLRGGETSSNDEVPLAEAPGTSGPTGRPSLLVVGDSGAATIADELEAAGPPNDVDVHVAAQIGCGLVGAGDGVRTPDGGFFADPAGCEEWPSRWSDLVRTRKPDAVLVLLAWGGLGDRDLGDGAPIGPCDPRYDRYYATQIDRAVDVLGADGAPVVFASVPPHGFDRSGDERTACLNALYADAATEPGVELLDLAKWTCEHAACADGPDDLRPDGVHFAGPGAADAADWIVDETARLADIDEVPFALFVGDSQALRLVENSPPTREMDLRVGSLAELGCGIVAEPVVMAGHVVQKDECAAPLAALPERIDALQPDLVVAHATVWEALDQVVDGETVSFGTARWEEELRANIRVGLRRLRGGHDLAVMTMPCFADGAGRDAFHVDQLDERVAAVDAAYVAEATAAGLPVVDYGARLCPDGMPVGELDGVVLRPDGVHLEQPGARVVWRWLGPELRRIATSGSVGVDGG